MAKVVIAVWDEDEGGFNIGSPQTDEILAKHRSGHELTLAEQIAMGMMANVKKAVDEWKRTGKFNIIPERNEGRGIIHNITEI